MNQLNKTNKVNFNIIGAGSVGHLWSAYLFKQSIKNQIFTRTIPLQSIAKLVSPQESFIYSPTYKTLNQWNTSACIIIAVKGNHLESVCKQLSLLNKEHTPIILMMNGLGLIEIAKQYLPKTPIYQASITHGVKKEYNIQAKQIIINHTGSGETLIGDINPNTVFSPKTDFNPRDNHTPYLLSPVIKVLNTALPLTRWHNDQNSALWIKLLVNAIINPLTSIYDVTNGEIIDNEEIQLQAKKLTKELSPIISHYLPHETWRSIFNEVKKVSLKTANNSSSMREDIRAKKLTEIAHINGYLLEKARELKINLYEHQLVMKQIKYLENKNIN